MINTESYLIIIWNRRILRTLDMVLHSKTEISEQQISKAVGRLYLYIYIIAHFNIMIHHPYVIINKQTLHETGIYPLVEQFKWYGHQAYGIGYNSRALVHIVFYLVSCLREMIQNKHLASVVVFFW